MSDGGATNHYDLKGCKDVDELAEMLDLRGDEFNCLKAIFGIAISRRDGKDRHAGTSAMRDAKKLSHYAQRIEKREEKRIGKIPEPKEEKIGWHGRGHSKSTYKNDMILKEIILKGKVDVLFTGDFIEFSDNFQNYMYQYHQNRYKYSIEKLNLGARIKLLKDE